MFRHTRNMLSSKAKKMSTSLPVSGYSTASTCASAGGETSSSRAFSGSWALAAVDLREALSRVDDSEESNAFSGGMVGDALGMVRER